MTYEMRLIPVRIMILISGKQPERLRACRFILLYTVLFSVPFLLRLQSIYRDTKCLRVLQLNLVVSTHSIPFYCVVGVIFGFLVKIPIIFLHYWLPKAHVEASASGRILLAGVLLKIGALGLFQLAYILPLVQRSAFWDFLVC
ncbi:proton-conducting transporter membrane subunit, partial [Bacillus albus]|uniref:proton-conducting transporter transmembrane domain-containing protein n=1 Tax=Bacillus albus TaxID=2026189 RepID=UPI002444688F